MTLWIDQHPSVDWDPVYLDLIFDNETFGFSPPMPRYVAEAVCFDFGQGIPWPFNGRRVIQAQIVPWSPPQ